MGESTLRCNNFKHLSKFIIVQIKIINVMWRQNTFIKFVIKHSSVKKHSTLIYLLEIFKFEKWVSKLLLSLNKIFNKKNSQFNIHRKTYHQNIFRKVFLGINVITSYYCWILHSLKYIIWRCIESILIDFKLFWYLFQKSSMLWKFKNNSWNSYNMIILYNML